MRWAIVVLAGCFHPSPPSGAPCGTHGECPDGLSCQLGACVAGDAAPRPDGAPLPIDACFASCSGPNTVLACDGTTTACDHGCLDNPPHCATIDLPLGLTDDLFDGATGPLTGTTLVFDSATGQIVEQGNGNQNVVLRAAGEGVIAGIGFHVVRTQDPALGVFVAPSITVPAGGLWTANGANAMVLLGDTIAIQGSLDAGGFGTIGGPSGGRGAAGNAKAAGCGAGANGGENANAAQYGGGGGGGGATAGGRGADPLGGAAGVLCGATTEPLVGGNGGAAGAIGDGGSGGAGGGGLAVVATTSVTITGTLASPGGGGKAPTAVGVGGGGGGGGGGAILVVAPTVTLSGAMTANGGGGGAPFSSGDGARGAKGSATPAAGGTFASVSGGNGGAKASPATAGATYVNDFGGGGGGAAGALAIRASSSAISGVISPSVTQSSATYH